LYLVVLAKDQPSPLGPESDDEKVTDPKKEDPKKEESKTDEAPKPKVADVKIDFEHINQRILALPLPPRRYEELQVGKPGMLFALEAPPRAPGPPAGSTVHRFDLKTRKSDVAVAGVRNFEVAENGEKVLYLQGERWIITTLKPMPPASGSAPPPPPSDKPETALKVENIEVKVDPRLEWKQMFHEAWRVERDFFYDPNLHGVDRAAIEKEYEPYVESIASRADLNYIFAETMGELSVGHLFVFGGDRLDVKRVPTGLLGADYKVENGRYRFSRVYDGENWNPQLKAPLTQPGINVVAGEYLLAVDGRDLRGSDNVFSFFENTAGKSVVLKVGPDPAGANAREVTVVPVPSETGLRNLAWIEDSRRKVDQMTHGRVAYVYMPDTSLGGLNSFTRYFFAQADREGVIIDERFNGGGALATDIIEILNRKLMSVVTPRDGHDLLQPQGAIFGPKVMIVNEYAGSGGDAMPWYFHRAGVGKLIGKRTWGGLVGIPGTPDLMDGGVVTAPSLAVWNPKGEWEVENRGISPDIEVDQDPELVRQGHDPQLEKAIEVVMADLEKNPARELQHPPYPNYHKSPTSN
jgi:tricorn protease